MITNWNHKSRCLTFNSFLYMSMAKKDGKSFTQHSERSGNCLWSCQFSLEQFLFCGKCQFNSTKCVRLRRNIASSMREAEYFTNLIKLYVRRTQNHLEYEWFRLCWKSEENGTHQTMQETRFFYISFWKRKKPFSLHNNSRENKDEYLRKKQHTTFTLYFPCIGELMATPHDKYALFDLMPIKLNGICVRFSVFQRNVYVVCKWHTQEMLQASEY